MLYKLLFLFVLVCLPGSLLLAQNDTHTRQVKELFENALVSIAREAAGKLVEMDTSLKEEEKEQGINILKAAKDLHTVISSVPGNSKNKTLLQAAFKGASVQGKDVKADSGVVAKVCQVLADQLAAKHTPPLAGADKKKLLQSFRDNLSGAVTAARTIADTNAGGANAAGGAIEKEEEQPKDIDTPASQKQQVAPLQKDDQGGGEPKNGDTKINPVTTTSGNSLTKYGVPVLLVLLVATGALWFFARKKSNQSIHSLKELLEDKNNQIQFLATELNNEQQKITSMARKSEMVNRPATPATPVQQPVATWQNNPLATGNYFFAEAMVTAGPRKNFSQDAIEGDYGLGEDVAGFIIRQDKAFFWVLDGTSDSDQLTKPLTTGDTRQEEIFSSRLLAQSIGWNLQQVIQNLPKQFTSQDLLKQAIQLAERDWQAKITSVAAAGAEAVEPIEQALQNKNGILQCSTTVIFGILDLQGRLDVCRVGDSKLVTWPGKNDFPKSTGRQFVTLQQKEKNISVSFNDFADLRSQHFQLDGIKTLIAMTDGISPQMETWLQNSVLDFSDRKTREIIAHFKQKTYDDKAMCIIQIKG